jgi:hypothetical protein
MNNALLTLGRLAGIAGLLLCLGSGFARVAGYYWIGKFETLTVLQVGTTGMVLGCFLLLFALTAKS